MYLKNKNSQLKTIYTTEIKCCACIIGYWLCKDGNTMLEQKPLKTYLHILQNEHLKSLVSNSTKTSGQMKKLYMYKLLQMLLSVQKYLIH